jgi:hypothetical protein
MDENHVALKVERSAWQSDSLVRCVTMASGISYL